MITYHGYNNPVYNVYEIVGAYYTQQNMVNIKFANIFSYYVALLIFLTVSFGEQKF